MPPNQPTNDPYGFITNAGAQQRRSFGGGSMKTRLMVVGGAGAVLLIVGILIIALLSGSGGGLAADYQTLLKQQTELIRISETGQLKARQADAKNLAITTSLSISGQQSNLIGIAKKAGAKTDAKTLALGKSVETDSKLNTADQTNQFDEVFIQTVKTQLGEYQQTLKKVYDASSSQATKDTLNKNYSDVSILLGKTSQ